VVLIFNIFFEVIDVTKCWVDFERYDMCENDFSNEELWTDFVEVLKEEIQTLEAVSGLIASDYLIVKRDEETVSGETVKMIDKMIADNLDAIEVIENGIRGQKYGDA